MRVYLTGGTGFVGSRIREILVEVGHTVVALTRTPRPAEQGVIWTPGDFGDVGSLTEGMRGCEAVVHLVGIIKETRGATFTAVHVEGTRHILAAMQAAGITRLLHMSALGAGPKADTAYFYTKWEAEEAVRAAGVAFTIFRPSIIYGPGDGFITLLARQVRHLPVIPVIGTGAYPLAPIALRAVAAAYVQALAPGMPAAHQTVELCGPDVLTYEALLDLLQAHLGTCKPKVHIPASLMRLVTNTAHLAHLPLPITRDQLTMLLKGNVCADSTAATQFDLPQVPLREGIGEYIHA